eukprot:749333-Hanusia_phi.AAC.1
MDESSALRCMDEGAREFLSNSSRCLQVSAGNLQSYDTSTQPTAGTSRWSMVYERSWLRDPTVDSEMRLAAQALHGKFFDQAPSSTVWSIMGDEILGRENKSLIGGALEADNGGLPNDDDSAVGSSVIIKRLRARLGMQEDGEVAEEAQRWLQDWLEASETTTTQDGRTGRGSTDGNTNMQIRPRRCSDTGAGSRSSSGRPPFHAQRCDAIASTASLVNARGRMQQIPSIEGGVLFASGCSRKSCANSPNSPFSTEPEQKEDSTMAEVPSRNSSPIAAAFPAGSRADSKAQRSSLSSTDVQRGYHGSNECSDERGSDTDKLSHRESCTQETRRQGGRCVKWNGRMMIVDGSQCKEKNQVLIANSSSMVKLENCYARC